MLSLPTDKVGCNSRQEKLQKIRQEVDKLNKYLEEHPRARLLIAVDRLTQKCKNLNISGWVSLHANDRTIGVTIDKEALMDEEKLDGCYVLKSDLSDEVATKETIHDRYKDLSYVESAFRSMKTVNLELRPIHVRLATRTRGHVFVVMLAYRIIKELSLRWKSLNVTVKEGIAELSTLCTNEVTMGTESFNQIPQARESVCRLIETARVTMPKTLPSKDIKVTTKKK